MDHEAWRGVTLLVLIGLLRRDGLGPSRRVSTVCHTTTHAHIHTHLATYVGSTLVHRGPTGMVRGDPPYRKYPCFLVPPSHVFAL